MMWRVSNYEGELSLAIVLFRSNGLILGEITFADHLVGSGELERFLKKLME